MTIQNARDVRAAIEELGLLDPTDRRERIHRAATPLDTLTGKRGGFLDNRKGNADVLLERVRELIGERYELADSRLIAKWIYSAPAADDVLAELSACDFVVTAIGD